MKPILGESRLLPLMLLLLLPLYWAPGAGEAAGALSGEQLEQRVRDITHQLRCPTCQGISVKDSQASFSVQIRDKVRRMIHEGQSEKQIKAFFVSRYGEWILRAPKKEGLGLVLWLLPGLGILGFGTWILFKVRQSAAAARGAVAGQAGAALTENERAGIERDLRRFEAEV